MFNFEYIIKKAKEYNPNWPEVPDHPYRILIRFLQGSGSGKTNVLLNLINNEPDLDQIYLQKIHMKQNINC